MRLPAMSRGERKGIYRRTLSALPGYARRAARRPAR